MPFLLPHEWLSKLAAKANLDISDLLPELSSHNTIFEHVAKVAAEISVGMKNMIPVGFHGDGVRTRGAP